MKLTTEKKQQFVDWLKSIGVNVDIFKCQVCAEDDFAVLDDIVFLPTGTTSAYPNVGLICTTCNHVNLFNVSGTKILDEDEKPNSSAIVCQECFGENATMQKDDGEYVCSACYNK